MGCHTRLNKAFEQALTLPFSPEHPICVFSDCHRGNGTPNDNFLKNEPLYLHALQYYERQGFTYIELGDGDELWENRNFQQIIEIHDEAFWLLRKFYRKNRLYMVYGNHDIIKKYPFVVKKKCSNYYCTFNQSYEELFPKLTAYPAIILKDICCGRELYLTHGHQASFLNSTLWPLSFFLVRYVWKPLEQIGLLDPTSAAKNYTTKEKAEQKLLSWAKSTGHILITGHTHRPVLGNDLSTYYNSGSCVHPNGITCLEIFRNHITLVKWHMTARENATLFVERKELASTVY